MRADELNEWTPGTNGLRMIDLWLYENLQENMYKGMCSLYVEYM